MKARTIVLLIFAVLLLPLSATAQDLHEPHEGTSMDCAARWHFVHNQIDAEEGILTVHFQNTGIIPVKSEDHSSKNLHYFANTSSADILISASDNIEGGKLLLSDVKCVEAPTTTTSTTTTTTAPTTTTTTAPTTTTTEKETTSTSTTSTTTSTTVPSTTSTTAGPPTTTVTTTPPPTLPETGIETPNLLFAGAALALLGTIALLFGREPVYSRPGRHTGGSSLNPLSLFKQGRHIA